MQQQAKLGMALLFASESVFFFILVLAFVIFRNQSVKIAAETLNVPLTSAYTFSLLASGFTVWRAARIVGCQRGGKARPWVAATILFGAVFLFGQGSEYLRMGHHGVTVSESLFGTTFFVLTGIHGLHVVIGIVLLLGVLWITGEQAPFSPGRVEAVQTGAAFWQFVDAVWVVIFFVLYVWTII
jgi:cytochrome c oxidase subunit III